jgi:hypothetical protein
MRARLPGQESSHVGKVSPWNLNSQGSSTAWPARLLTRLPLITTVAKLVARYLQLCSLLQSPNGHQIGEKNFVMRSVMTSSQHYIYTMYTSCFFDYFNTRRQRPRKHLGSTSEVWVGVCECVCVCVWGGGTDQKRHLSPQTYVRCVLRRSSWTHAK